MNILITEKKNTHVVLHNYNSVIMRIYKAGDRFYRRHFQVRTYRNHGQLIIYLFDNSISQEQKKKWTMSPQWVRQDVYRKIFFNPYIIHTCLYKDASQNILHVDIYSILLQSIHLYDLSGLNVIATINSIVESIVFYTALERCNTCEYSIYTIYKIWALFSNNVVFVQRNADFDISELSKTTA